MFEDLFEKCIAVSEKYDYDKLRTLILIMLNDPRTNDEKIFRVLGRSGYDRQTISHVLDAMRQTSKKVGPLERRNARTVRTTY